MDDRTFTLVEASDRLARVTEYLQHFSFSEARL